MRARVLPPAEDASPNTEWCVQAIKHGQARTTFTWLGACSRADQVLNLQNDSKRSGDAQALAHTTILFQ